MNQNQETDEKTMTISIDGKTIELCFTQEENRGLSERIRNILVSAALLETENITGEAVDAA